MQNVILVIHILACLAMIGLVLVQKSEGGGLGIGGGAGNALMSGRGAAGALVRTTMIFGAIFFATSLILTSIANRQADNRSGIERILDESNPQTAPQQGPVDLFDPTAPLLNDTAPASPDVGIAPAPQPAPVDPTEEAAPATESVPENANPQ
ncbi:preprotein translocase subunit SecG [Hyphomonas sp. CACIAM 19H1]|uniref:preprotein translocase subunit SecG n=1 Tax=Hyphomonas sp. CACIAM 19H1 TaxID=1873716 RepID=UPI000DED6025|nr:preprotein translocase subunit SecG [Hyphomonas sp. CACIAM 19H1]AXE64227.1 preprotein translocase subunit SecG [Hyphomonas sp. CACIAM 19H1]